MRGDAGEPRLMQVGHGVEELLPPEAPRHNPVELDDLECDAVCVSEVPSLLSRTQNRLPGNRDRRGQPDGFGGRPRPEVVEGTP